MNETKRLLKNTGIIAIGNLSAKVVSFFLLPLYTAILTTEEYGTIDYIITLSAFSVPFISFLMDEAIFRFLIDCKTKEDKEKIISISVFVVLSGLLIFLVIVYPILYYVEYQYSILLIIFIASEILNLIISALLRGIGRTDAFAVYNFLSSVLQIALNVIFIAIFYWGIIGMLSAMIIGRILVSIIYIYELKLWKYIKYKVLDKNVAREMIKYSIPLIPNKVSWLIINLSSRIVIMGVLSSNFVGLYAISSKFATAMDMIYGFFYQSWKESSARVMQDDNKNEFYNLVYKYLKRFMYAIVLVLTACMPIIFKFLIADSFKEAILYVPILLISTYFMNISGFYGGIFTAYKDTKIMGTTTILAAIINLVLMFITIKFGGLYAVSLSALVANFVVYQYRKIKVRKYVILKENKYGILSDWLMTTMILSLFYTMNFKLQILGIIISFIYAVITNYIVFKIILSKFLKRE